MKKKLLSVFGSLLAAFALAPAALADVIPFDPNSPPPEITVPPDITVPPEAAATPSTSPDILWVFIVALLMIVASLIVIAVIKKKAAQK